MRKKLKRIADKKNPKPEQDAHNAAERVIICKYCLQKKEREQALILTQTPIQSPYNTKQSSGKALKHVTRSLPNFPRKTRFVIAKMAKEMGLQVKGIVTKNDKGLSEEHTNKIKEFYQKDGI